MACKTAPLSTLDKLTKSEGVGKAVSPICVFQTPRATIVALEELLTSGKLVISNDACGLCRGHMWSLYRTIPQASHLLQRTVASKMSWSLTSRHLKLRKQISLMSQIFNSHDQEAIQEDAAEDPQEA